MSSLYPDDDYILDNEVSAKEEPDCGFCNDTGWALVGHEFNGNPVTEPCPGCGAGDDRIREMDGVA